MEVRYERSARQPQGVARTAAGLRRFGFLGLVLLPLVAVVPAQTLAQSTEGPLLLTLEATPDPVHSQGRASYTITVTNAGDADLAEVELLALLPDYIRGFYGRRFGATCLGSSTGYCDDGGTLRWRLAELKAGQSRAVSYSVRVDGAPEGVLLSAVANAHGSGGVSASDDADVFVDSNRPLILGMSEDRAPVASGQRLVYTLNYANGSDGNQSGVELRFPLPEGTRVVSASGDGMVSGDEVIWELGVLESHESGQRTLTVQVDPAATTGGVIAGQARMGSEAGNVARSTAVTAVQVDAPLVLTMKATPDPVRRGGRVSYTITATNAGDADLALVVRALLPGYIRGFYGREFGAECLGSSTGYCDDGETLQWEVDRLKAGQSWAVSYSVQVDGALEGALLSGVANAYGSGGHSASASVDVVVDSDPEPTPRIDRTDPEVVAGSVCSQSLTVYGRGFTSGSTVTLSNYETAETFTDVPIASQSSTRLTVDYTFPVTAGTWAVEVTDPEGRPSGEFVFEVTEPSEGDAAPAAPTALSANPDDKEVTLSWSASAECDLKEYRLYRGTSSNPTERVATIPKGTETYTDAGLSNGQAYHYRLTAVDEAGNESDYSDEINVTPVVPEDVTAPNAPAGLTALAGGNKITLEWTANAEDDLKEYRLYRGTSPNPTERIATLPKGTRTYDDTDVAVGQTYHYRITAVDASDNESGYSDGVSARIEDTQAPAAPADLKATAANGEVTLSWAASPDGDLKEYRIYRGTSSDPTDQIATVTAGTETYTDAGLSPGMYYYRLKAVDTAGNGSDYSSEARATIEDTQAPAAPTSLTATAGDGVVTLKWTANAESDLKEYRLYRGSSPGPTDQIATVAAGTETYTDDNLPGDGTYYYRLKAVDAADNESAFTSDASVSYTPTAVALGGEVPEAFALAQNYPNPFNPATTIIYDVAQPSDVRVLVYDLLGKAVATLVDEHHAAGRYEVTFDARGLPSGAYLYTLRAGDFTQTRRLVLLK